MSRYLPVLLLMSVILRGGPVRGVVAEARGCGFGRRAGLGAGLKCRRHRYRRRCAGRHSAGCDHYGDECRKRRRQNDRDGRERAVPSRRHSTWTLQPQGRVAGFATQEVKDITLTIGLEYTKDFTLGIQGVQESITITGESPLVETTRTE